MTDLILHKHEDYIEEDLAYYFSAKRDINKQILPNTDIYSLTPNSPHFNLDFTDGKIGNLFALIPPYSIDRIYIGISFPIFANNWGQAFLRYLMTRVVHVKGSVILPVYPEMQASEKNYWSRSILENSFLSRSRWKGTSNIWAENDGVMSLRIGRIFPTEIKSTLAYFFEEAGNTIVRRSLEVTSPEPPHESLFDLGNKYWSTANTYAITEQIIQDYFGMKKPITMCDIGNSNGLLGLESLLSNYINVTQAVSFITDNNLTKDIQEISNYFYSDIKERFSPIIGNAIDALNHATSYDIICFNNATLKCSVTHPLNELLAHALEKLSPGGILIVYEEQGLAAELMQLLDRSSNIKYYSSLVASQLETDEPISHYSSAIENELLSENRDRKAVFRVIQR